MSIPRAPLRLGVRVCAGVVIIHPSNGKKAKATASGQLKEPTESERGEKESCGGTVVCCQAAVTR